MLIGRANASVMLKGNMTVILLYICCGVPFPHGKHFIEAETTLFFFPDIYNLHIFRDDRNEQFSGLPVRSIDITQTKGQPLIEGDSDGREYFNA